jgi:hypothetical protein
MKETPSRETLLDDRFKSTPPGEQLQETPAADPLQVLPSRRHAVGAPFIGPRTGDNLQGTPS